VRPEHARPWAEEAGLIGPLEGVVEYAEALGRETFLGVRRDGGPRLVVRVEGRSGAQPGDRVAYGQVPGGLRFFDPQTGDAIERPR
jgi:ABC-type sugar transport system ATPase subunit